MASVLTPAKVHKELTALAREALKAEWSLVSTEAGKVQWRTPDGKIVVQHAANLHEGSRLIPSTKTKIRKALDEQYQRQKAAKAAARVLEEERMIEAAAAAQAAGEARMASTPKESPLPPTFLAPEPRTEASPEPVEEEPSPPEPALKDEFREIIAQGEVGPRFPFRLAMLPVKELKVAEIGSGGYQRPIDPNWAIQLAIPFSWDDFGRVEVSFRDGIYWVVDGQHRLAALDLTDRVPADRKLEVPALIYEGMTLEDEADRYLQMNTRRKNTFSLHAWAARLVSDPKAREINEIVEAAGYRISQGMAPGKGFVSAVGRTELIYDDFGPEGLKRTLAVLSKTYGSETPVSAALLGGVALVLNIYDGVDEERLVEVLGRVPAAGWIARVKFFTSNPGVTDAASGFRPSTQPVALAQMLVHAYNVRIAPEKTLGSFDAAYGQYITNKRLSARNRYVAAKRAEFAREKPRPGSWLQQSRRY